MTLEVLVIGAREDFGILLLDPSLEMNASLASLTPHKRFFLNFGSELVDGWIFKAAQLYNRSVERNEYGGSSRQRNGSQEPFYEEKLP